jgi:hypothetical protein
MYVGERITEQWRMLRVILGVPNHKLRQIECNSRFSVDKGYEVLCYWRKHQPRSASRAHLMNALREAELVALAEDIASRK